MSSYSARFQAMEIPRDFDHQQLYLALLQIPFTVPQENTGSISWYRDILIELYCVFWGVLGSKRHKIAFKTHNEREAHQVAFYKRSRGTEPRNSLQSTSWWLERDFNSESRDFTLLRFRSLSLSILIHLSSRWSIRRLHSFDRSCKYGIIPVIFVWLRRKASTD